MDDMTGNADSAGQVAWTEKSHSHVDTWQQIADDLARTSRDFDTACMQLLQSPGEATTILANRAIVRWHEALRRYDALKEKAE